MLRGLKEMQPKLEALNIPFFIVKGDPMATIPKLVKDTKAALLVTDFATLRDGRRWRDTVSCLIVFSCVKCCSTSIHKPQVSLLLQHHLASKQQSECKLKSVKLRRKVVSTQEYFHLSPGIPHHQALRQFANGQQKAEKTTSEARAF